MNEHDDAQHSNKPKRGVFGEHFAEAFPVREPAPARVNVVVDTRTGRVLRSGLSDSDAQVELAALSAEPGGAGRYVVCGQAGMVGSSADFERYISEQEGS